MLMAMRLKVAGSGTVGEPVSPPVPPPVVVVTGGLVVDCADIPTTLKNTTAAIDRAFLIGLSAKVRGSLLQDIRQRQQHSL
jgi:hypothetical protein